MRYAGIQSSSLVALCLSAAVALPAVAQPVPLETPASSNRRLLDPEFNPGKGLATWVDIVDGSIWISGVDRATGAFVPEDGRGRLVERNAAPFGGLGFTLNGPEWVLGTTDYVVWTRFIDRSNPTPSNAQIGAAFQRPDGSWAVRTVSSDRRLSAPYGSENPNDPAPRITYNDDLGKHWWRELTNPGSEEAIPLLANGLLPAVRHLRSATQRALIYPATVQGQTQVVLYDVDTKAIEQITDGADTKEQPWAWVAPDFNNDLVAMATVGKSRIDLLRRAPAGGWSRVMSIDSPVAGGRFFSSEPFVYEGRSYALVQLIVGDYPSSIWLLGFDPAQPLVRRLTPKWPDRARADPEIFVTDRGPIVFYSRFDPTKGTDWLCVPCAEGLFRVDTGLPAPTAR